MTVSRLEPRSPRRSRRRQATRQRSHTDVAWETIVKLAVNVGICTVAAIAFVRIVADDRANRQELQQVRTELQRTRERVDRAEAEFGRHFDPQQTPIVVQEQSHYSDPQQVRIIWSPDR